MPITPKAFKQGYEEIDDNIDIIRHTDVDNPRVPDRTFIHTSLNLQAGSNVAFL